MVEELKPTMHFDSEFVTMYGTERYGINEDGRVMDVDNDKIVVNPWLKRIDPFRQISINDSAGSSITASLAQLVMYTFYGVMDAPIKLHYPDEPPTASNCYYDTHINLEKGVTTEKVFFGEEEFRAYHTDGEYVYYISRNGVIVAVRRLIGDMYEHRFLKWRYRYAYPWLSIPKKGGALHVAVWDLWSDEGYVPYQDVHHKDEHLWNPSIDNLELLSKGEHRRMHGGVGTHRMTTYDDIIHIFEQLQDRIPMYRIAQEYAARSGLTEPEARRQVSRMLYKDIFPEIRKDYKLDREFYMANKNREKTVTDEMVNTAIDMLLEGNSTDREIAQVSGLRDYYVRAIRTKSGSFMYHPVVMQRMADVDRIGTLQHQYYPQMLDNDTLHQIIDLLQRTNYTNKEIAQRFNCTAETMRRICRGEGEYSHVGPVERVFSTQSIRMRNGVTIELPKDDPRVVEIRNRMKQF